MNDTLRMANTNCTYEVVLQDGTQVHFDATAFMLWSGLHDYLNITHPTWATVEYIYTDMRYGEIMGKIFNR